MNSDEFFARQIHDEEQSRQWIMNTIPPMLFGFFERCKREGFTESQAFTLTESYLVQIVANSAGE